MILAGDIGATHARLAAFDAGASRLAPVVEKVYESGKHSNLREIISSFITSEGVPIHSACIGAAGPVRNGQCKVSNLPWTIDVRELAAQLRLRNAGLINDLEALAYGIDVLESSDFVTLREGSASDGNACVVSAGSGLGEAGLYWDGHRHHPFACEGGHSEFAPKNDVEIELLRYLMAKYQDRHVSYERVLSGPGLKNVYDFLRDAANEQEPEWLREQLAAHDDPPALISQLGLEGKVPICERALSIFVSVFGSEAGNCALKFMATGGVYIAGIPAKTLPAFQEGAFLHAFQDKGRMRGLLEEMPVRVILNDDAGLLGAARFTLIQKAFRS